MEKTKKIKILIGLVYLIALSVSLYFLFSKFSLQQILSYTFIKSTASNLLEYRETNLFLVFIIFILFGILWISMLQGFASPLLLAAGFVFGPYNGTVIAVLTLSFAATLTYLFANFFFKDLIKEKFSNKFKFIEEKIKANEFFAIFFLRFIGGTPVQIQNLLPVLFNVKLKNYFFGSFLGFIPQSFIVCFLGSGLSSQIAKNTGPPSFFEMIKSSEIYVPILAFFFLIILAFVLRKLFFKN